MNTMTTKRVAAATSIKIMRFAATVMSIMITKRAAAAMGIMITKRAAAVMNTTTTMAASDVRAAMIMEMTRLPGKNFLVCCLRWRCLQRV